MTTNHDTLTSELNELLDMRRSKLTELDTADTEQYIDAGEYELALELLINASVELRQTMSAQERTLAIALARRMDMYPAVLERMRDGHHVKVAFPFVNFDGGTEIETMWTLPRDGGFEIDNIPFYAMEVACGDVVAAELDSGGQLRFTKLLRPSGHSTIRLLFEAASDVQPVRARLREMGCDSEISDIHRLVAVDVPPSVDYAVMQAYFEKAKADGQFEYEEACLGFR